MIRAGFDSTAGDDLERIARELEHNREFLLSLCTFRVIDADALEYLRAAEQAVRAFLAPRWERCQHVLANATAEELAEVEITWMGHPMPTHFDKMTVESLRAACGQKHGLRVPTNPATNWMGELC